MAKFLKLQFGGVPELARQVAAELGRGLAVVPVLGGYCVLAREQSALDEWRVTSDEWRVARLVGQDEIRAAMGSFAPEFAVRASRVMAGPVVAGFGASGTLLALANEPLAAELMRASELWVAVPEEPMEPGEMADEPGRKVSVVVTGPEPGPGPTVVDFGRRPVVVDRRGKLGILDLERELGELVRLGPGLFFSVLIVCTGNSCRSPMAHAVLAGMLAGLPVFVYSAGTAAPVGGAASAGAIEATLERGVDLIRHRAQQLDAQMIRGADLVLVMELHHRDQVLELVPEAADRTRLLLEYGDGGKEVEDPIGGSIELYRRTLDQMVPALGRIATEIRFRAGAVSGPTGGHTKEN